MKENYYVYALLDPRKPGLFKVNDEIVKFKPFYIGKGKNNRINTHVQKYCLTNKKQHKVRTILKIYEVGLEPITFYIKEHLEEEVAYELETLIIEQIGLANLTNCWPGGKGGRNNKNFSGKRHTKEAKEKIRQSKLGEKNHMYGTGWYRTDEGKKAFLEKCSGENHPGFGIARDETTKDKIRKKLKGIPKPSEDNKKRSESMKEVWKYRKQNNIKINKANIGNKLKAINQLSGEEILFNSQKECQNFFKKSFKFIKKIIGSNEQLNNYIIFRA